MRIKWTEEKCNYLIMNYNKKPLHELCKHLNSTPAAVKTKAKYLGVAKQIKKDSDLYYKKLEFAKSLGFKNIQEAFAKISKREFELKFKTQ